MKSFELKKIKKSFKFIFRSKKQTLYDKENKYPKM